MTIRPNKPFKELGQELFALRKQQTDKPANREQFIEAISHEYFDDEIWISSKALMNLELGKNLPKLETVPNLAVALQIEPVDLFKLMLPYLNSSK